MYALHAGLVKEHGCLAFKVVEGVGVARLEMNGYLVYVN